MSIVRLHHLWFEHIYLPSTRSCYERLNYSNFNLIMCVNNQCWLIYTWHE